MGTTAAGTIQNQEKEESVLFKTISKPIVSLLLALVMAFSLIVPGRAASGQVSISFADGTSTTLVNTKDILLHEIGATDVASVKVSDGVITDTYTDFTETIDKTLTGGTRYQLYVSTSSTGVKSLRFKYLNTLSDDISIEVTGKAVAYRVSANSGAYGQNGNLGGTATCAMTGSGSTTVTGGSSYSVTFTPKAGQEITKLNLRVDAADGTGKIVDPVNASVTVGAQTFVVKALTDGKVSVSTTSTVRDLFITALTKDETQKYYLTTSTDNNCTADLSSELLAAGSTRSIKFTPYSGFVVSEITITDGTQTGTIALTASSVRVNSKTYSVTRSADGSAVVSVPALSDNVTVSAIAENDINVITVNESLYVNSTKAGIHYIDDGDDFSFYYTPETGAYIRTLTIESPSLGTKTLYIGSVGTVYDSNQNFYYSNGKYFNGTFWQDYFLSGISVVYEDNGSLYIKVADVSENMVFSVNDEEYVHEVGVVTDNGVTTDKYTHAVDTGDDLALVFTPTSSSYSITTIKINYGDSVYSPSVKDGAYILVGGVRWYVRVADDGVVTLEMNDVAKDVIVTVSSNYTAASGLRITTSADSNSVITYTGSNPFNYTDTTTVHVYTKKSGYILDLISFKVGSTTYTIDPFDTELTIAGVTYAVRWVDNTDVSVYFHNLPGSMTISSRAVSGTVETPSTGDGSSGGTVVPPSSSGGSSGYHQAYMIGYGNGYFGPNDSLTRAQAVTLLNRVLTGGNDAAYANYAYNNSFIDVKGGTWYAGAVNYAASLGYLDIFKSSGSAFSPNAPITRAEYLTLLCEYLCVDVSEVSTASLYADVDSTHWAAKYINYATNVGWVQGTGNSMFAPNRAVSRAEIAVMTNHVLGRVADPSAIADTGPIFNDVPITFWAFADIFEAAKDHYGTFYSGYEAWA